MAFSPGRGYLYSGVNYALLGTIITTMSGMDYESYMQANVLGPLGMTHSTFVPEKADPALLVTRHRTNADGTVVVSEEMECDPRRQAACTLHSTCEDMTRYARFSLNQGELDGQTILGQESFDKMISTIIGPPPESAENHYNRSVANPSLGWSVGLVGDYRVFGKSGGILGANAHMIVAPDDVSACHCPGKLGEQADELACFFCRH